MAKSSLGLDKNVVGLLCYVVGFVTGIVFLALEKESTFVKFHAVQSIIAFGGFFVLSKEGSGPSGNSAAGKILGRRRRYR